MSERNKVKSRVCVRLYKTYDMDLIKVYLLNTLEFAKEAKRALTMAASGKEYVFFTDVKQQLDDDDILERLTKERVFFTVYITIRESGDEALIEMLNALKPRMRASFVKTIIRRSLPELPLDLFFEKPFSLVQKQA